MCLGIPMKVISTVPGFAVCDRNGEQFTIDMKLVGEQPEGTWILTFLDAAREVIDETKAKEISNAISALELAFQGEQNLDYLFQDLIDKGPELPDHLKATPITETEKET